MGETLMLDEAAQASHDAETTVRTGASDRKAADDVQEGYVCERCWQTHPPGDAPACSVCGQPRPGQGWTTMPFIMRERYLMVRLLGRGAQGAVFLARDTQGKPDGDGRLPVLAVKLIQQTKGADRDRVLRMFEHEAAVMPLLGRSPYFVKTFGYDSGTSPYLAMEFVPWPTLKKHMQAGPLPLPRTARLGIALLEAVEVMHYFRVVHRDLKPSNVFVFQDPGGGYRIKIADLGVWTWDHEAATPQSMTDEEKLLAGTLAYMSPEQLTLAPVGGRSDLHTVGTILWHATTGALPWPLQGQTLKDQLFSRRELIQTIPDCPSSMPRPLYRVLRQAMQPRPDDRFTNASEMVRALRLMLRGWTEERAGRDDILLELNAVTQRVAELRKHPRHRGAVAARLDRVEAAVARFRSYIADGGEIAAAVFSEAIAVVRRDLTEAAEELEDPYRREAPTPTEEIVSGEEDTLALPEAAEVIEAPPRERYDFGQLIGAGGMGRVYRGRHLALGAPVAIKMLNQTRTPGLDEEHHRKLFIVQAETASLLRHPNTVQTRDLDITPEGVPFLVNELVEGVSLKALMSRRGAMPEADAARLLAPVASALAEAHALRILHRNVKPGRILLEPLPGIGVFPKLFGFGLPQDRVDELLPKSMVYGTPQYMAPEQVLGRPTGPPADLYALGVILYEMLTGGPLFRVKGSRNVMRAKVLQEAPRLPERFALSQLAAALLRREPEAREWDAAGVAAHLHDLHTGSSGS